MRNWPGYVQTAREHIGMTRRQLADAAGVNYVTIWRWETGKQTPERADAVVRFAEVTGVNVDEALAVAGLRPASDVPETPRYQQAPLDPDMAIINERLLDPSVSEEEKHLIRAQLRYLVELAERPAQRPAGR